MKSIYDKIRHTGKTSALVAGLIALSYSPSHADTSGNIKAAGIEQKLEGSMQTNSISSKSLYNEYSLALETAAEDKVLKVKEVKGLRNIAMQCITRYRIENKYYKKSAEAKNTAESSGTSIKDTSIESMKQEIESQRAAIREKIIFQLKQKLAGKTYKVHLDEKELALYIALGDKEIIDRIKESSEELNDNSINLQNYRRLKDEANVWDSIIYWNDKWRKDRFCNKSYYSISLVSLLIDRPSKDWPQIENGNEIDIDGILKYYGLTAELEDFRKDFPIKTKLPLEFSIAAGFIWPWLFKLALAKYTKREFDDWDAASTVLLSAVIGTLFLDGMHPLIYPIRMIALPIITEPIRRLSKMNKTGKTSHKNW